MRTCECTCRTRARTGMQVQTCAPCCMPIRVHTEECAQHAAPAHMHPCTCTRAHAGPPRSPADGPGTRERRGGQLAEVPVLNGLCRVPLTMPAQGDMSLRSHPHTRVHQSIHAGRCMRACVCVVRATCAVRGCGCACAACAACTRVSAHHVRLAGARADQNDLPRRVDHRQRKGDALGRRLGRVGDRVDP